MSFLADFSPKCQGAALTSLPFRETRVTKKWTIPTVYI